MAIRLLFLTEEEEEEVEADYGSAFRRPPRRLAVSDDFAQRYLDSVDDLIVTHSRLALVRQRRYHWSMALSIGFSLSVPVVIAADVATWIAALLGGAAAFLQGVQQILGDGRHAAEHHAMARQLSGSRRRLLVDRANGVDEAKAIANFMERTETLRAESNLLTDQLERSQLAEATKAIGGPSAS
ncbi:hypothetical protein [Gordonia malaquae]|uniref:hypothetical protein n=1 Tax=Gordonia malaquae TaxID=410332 RepID=UPI0030FE7DFD